MYNNVPAAFPNPDMLQGVLTLQNGYSAVDGRDAGAVVNMITKSGTNRLHGSAYEFLRNSCADAKEEFATIVPLPAGTSMAVQWEDRLGCRTTTAGTVPFSSSGLHGTDSDRLREYCVLYHCSHGTGTSG